MSRPVVVSVGIFLLVAAVYATAAPGRIDMIDGQYRFEVARNLIEEGSARVRDPFLGGSVRGLDGWYAPYSLAGSVVPIPLILVAKWIGPPSVDREQFFFSFTSAIFGAATAAVLFLFYTTIDVTLRRALLWALVAAFATLVFPAATTVFDQTQHAFFVITACVLAFLGARRGSMRLTIAGGLALAILVNFQESYVVLFPTLGIATLGLPWMSAEQRRDGIKRYGAFVLVGATGLVVWAFYNYVRFGSMVFSGKGGVNHPPIIGNPFIGLVGLLFSPGKSIFLYSPATAAALFGVYRLIHRERSLGLAVATTSAAHIGLISLLTFYGGDWCWGPRYFIPILSLLALGFPFAQVPSVTGRVAVRTLIAAGVVVQLLGLSLDLHRFFYARSLPPFFWYTERDFYFRESALLARPGELLDSLEHGVPLEAGLFRPGPYPRLLTYAVFGGWGHPNMPLPLWMRRYRLFWLPRPWPLWMATVPPEERPIDLQPAAAILLLIGLTGLWTIRQGVRSDAAFPAVPATQPE